MADTHRYRSRGRTLCPRGRPGKKGQHIRRGATTDELEAIKTAGNVVDLHTVGRVDNSRKPTMRSIVNVIWKLSQGKTTLGRRRGIAVVDSDLQISLALCTLRSKSVIISGCRCGARERLAVLRQSSFTEILYVVGNHGQLDLSDRASILSHRRPGSCWQFPNLACGSSPVMQG